MVLLHPDLFPKGGPVGADRCWCSSPFGSNHRRLHDPCLRRIGRSIPEEKDLAHYRIRDGHAIVPSDLWRVWQIVAREHHASLRGQHRRISNWLGSCADIAFIHDPRVNESLLARADLTAIRYSAQVGSAVAVFIVTWIVLPTDEEAMGRLVEEDSYKFRNIVLTLTSIGLMATILFHVFLKENLLEDLESHKGNIEEARRLFDGSQSSRTSLVATTILLRVAMLYVASRLFITLATVYLPLYIEETDIDGKEALATVPLVSYVSSFVAALLLKYINKSCGTKVCYFLGTLIGIISATVTEYGGTSKAILYIVAILIGSASSITMVTALSVTAEIIGPRTERSAIVYSIVTFFDKVVTGLVVIFIEKLRCTQPTYCPNYNRDTLALVCVLSMLLGLVTLFSVSRCLN